MATFSTSHTCHMWRISDFSTSVMWRHLKFLHMWRNFQFPHNCDAWKAKIFPHDNFFSTNIIRDIRDKYEICVFIVVRFVHFLIFAHLYGIFVNIKISYESFWCLSFQQATLQNQIGSYNHKCGLTFNCREYGEDSGVWLHIVR